MHPFLGYFHQTGIGAHFIFKVCFDGVYLKICQRGILNFSKFVRSARKLLSILLSSQEIFFLFYAVPF
jgi:hypothetical protein